MVLGRVQVLEIPMCCCCLVTKSCLTLCDPMNCSTPGIVSRNFLKLMSIKSVMPSNHLILCCFLPLLPSVFPSIRVFSHELALLIRCCIGASATNECWCPSNEYSGLISFQIDWCDLFAVQGTLKSLLQHQSSKASIIQYSAFFVVQGSLLSIYCISYIWRSEIYISSSTSPK